jgi:ribonuclease G
LPIPERVSYPLRSMKKEIFISAEFEETRVAITENGSLAEYFIDMPDKERLVGSIFLGKVQKIVQGMNAAFIDIGLEQDAFLHFSDVDSSMEDSFDVEDDEEEEELSEQATEALRVSTSRKPKRTKPVFQTKRSGDVVINLQPKQMVLVQVVREAYSSKGVRVTTRISLPGRYVVFLPFENVIGVSKKIESFKERKRLRQLAKQVLPSGSGCIIRTASQHHTDIELKKDWDFLLENWKEIETKVKESSRPVLVYKDVSIANTIIRDVFTKDVHRAVINNKRLFREVEKYLDDNAPTMSNRLQLYTSRRPMFESLCFQRDIENIFSKRVQLPGGGYIIFDHTEAMLVIDVNSGRATFDSDQDNNAVKVNLEAAREIARQLRLRDVGGMIVVDFIDMGDERNRTRLFNEMKREMLKDRAKSVVYPVTQLGLIQITRQRIRQNMAEWVSESCPTCDGTGRVNTKGLLFNQIDRWLFSFRSKSREFRLVLRVHPTVASYLSAGSLSKLTKLMIRYFVKISLQPDPNVGVDTFYFTSVRQSRDVTGEYGV